MKILYLDCFSGISGDMFLGAMLDLGLDLSVLQAEIAKLQLPESLALKARREERCGIAGVKFDVVIPEHDHHSHDSGHHDHSHSHEHDHGHECGHHHHDHHECNDSSHHHGHGHQQHDHSHEHGHHHHVHGRTYADIRALINQSRLSISVKGRALAIFKRVAEAEAKIHGKNINTVHFHEVGALDSIADIVGAAVAVEHLQISGVEASPLVEGSGSVHCAHGHFPLPAPATLEILRGIPLKQINLPHELITPTGAAILAELCTSFSGLSGLAVEKIGYGLGSRNFPDRPNVLRAMIGNKTVENETGSSAESNQDQVLVIESNLDDATGEELGHLAERLAQAGAFDVSFIPMTMKKNRPGHLLQVIAPTSVQDQLIRLLFNHSPSFGLRIQKTDRFILDRQIITVDSTHGPIRVKVGHWEGRPVQIHPEYEDCHQASLKSGRPLREIIEEAKTAASEKVR